MPNFLSAKYIPATLAPSPEANIFYLILITFTERYYLENSKYPNKVVLQATEKMKIDCNLKSNFLPC